MMQQKHGKEPCPVGTATQVGRMTQLSQKSPAGTSVFSFTASSNSINKKGLGGECPFFEKQRRS